MTYARIVHSGGSHHHQSLKSAHLFAAACRTVVKAQQARNALQAELQAAKADHQLHATKLNSEINRLKLQLREAEGMMRSEDERCVHIIHTHYLSSWASIYSQL